MIVTRCTQIHAAAQLARQIASDQREGRIRAAAAHISRISSCASARAAAIAIADFRRRAERPCPPAIAQPRKSAMRRARFRRRPITLATEPSMRSRRYFLPILRDDPKEAEIVSHRLMLRAGMIRQQAAGIYSWLPLGFRVLSKIEQIVREEQDRAGALEILMPTIQSADLWRESGRYDDYGKEMLRINDRHEREMLYGPTNEELITEIFRDCVKSYRDLPLNLYHIQWKFRDEVRPRFGVMRGREFLMKDAYSFDLDYRGRAALLQQDVRRPICAPSRAWG